jgi:hypothetical protein
MYLHIKKSEQNQCTYYLHGRTVIIYSKLLQTSSGKKLYFVFRSPFKGSLFFGARMLFIGHRSVTH